MSDGMATALFVVVLLAVWVPLLWFSIRAKPLGGKPYRWGNYVGITTGLVAVAGLVAVVPKLARLDLGLVVYLAFVISAGICSWGILNRRRIGVVMLVVSYSLLIMLPAFLATFYHQPVTSADSASGPALLAYTIVTFIYFKRRWHLMGKPVDNSAPKLETPTKPRS